MRIAVGVVERRRRVVDADEFGARRPAVDDGDRRHRLEAELLRETHDFRRETRRGRVPSTPPNNHPAASTSLLSTGPRHVARGRPDRVYSFNCAPAMPQVCRHAHTVTRPRHTAHDSQPPLGRYAPGRPYCGRPRRSAVALPPLGHACHAVRRTAGARTAGQTIWAGTAADGEAGVAWDWMQIARGVVAMADPMSVVTNLRLVGNAGRSADRACNRRVT